MRRILLTIARIVALEVSATTLDVPKFEGFVNDYAGMISPGANSPSAMAESISTSASGAQFRQSPLYLFQHTSQEY